MLNCPPTSAVGKSAFFRSLATKLPGLSAQRRRPNTYQLGCMSSRHRFETLSRPYGQLGLVSIAENADEFIAAAEKIFGEPANVSWQNDVKDFLDQMSWDRTWSAMDQLIEEVLSSKTPERPQQRSVLAM